MTFTVKITVPPSLNNAYFNAGKRRVMKPAVREWKRATAWEICLKVDPVNRIKGPFDVLLELPLGMRGDADNRLKLALDALVMSGRVPDDRKATKVTASKCDSVEPGTAILHVRAA